jgi:hypothetical protein
VNLVSSRATWCRREILEATVDLAVEIANEGREGRHRRTVRPRRRRRRAGLLAPAHPDPLAGHAPGATHIAPAAAGTLKELAQLDGASVMSDDGAVVAACRYLDVSAEGIELPLGLGRRHLTAAAVSRQRASWQLPFLRAAWCASFAAASCWPKSDRTGNGARRLRRVAPVSERLPAGCR